MDGWIVEWMDRIDIDIVMDIDINIDIDNRYGRIYK